MLNVRDGSSAALWEAHRRSRSVVACSCSDITGDAWMPSANAPWLVECDWDPGVDDRWDAILGVGDDDR